MWTEEAKPRNREFICLARGFNGGGTGLERQFYGGRRYVERGEN